MKFKIGIEIERTSSTIAIVECEADSLEEANRIAFKGAMKRAREASSIKELFPKSSDHDWQDDLFGANCVSSEISQDEIENYSVDFEVGT